MDEMEKNLEKNFQKIKSEITTITDEELESLGSETQALVSVLRMMVGEKHPNYVRASNLLEILSNEWRRRNEEQPSEPQVEKASVKVKMQTPSTYNQLMCLGDGSVVEPQIIKKH